MTPAILAFWHGKPDAWVGAYARQFLAARQVSEPGAAHATAVKAADAAAEALQPRPPVPAPHKPVQEATEAQRLIIWTEYLKAFERYDPEATLPIETSIRTNILAGLYRLWSRYEDDPMPAILAQIRGAFSDGWEKPEEWRPDPEWVLGGKITRCKALRAIGIMTTKEE